MKRRSPRGISSYQDINVSTKIAYANSLELTEMLFNGLSESLAQAEGQFIRSETEARGATISRCLKILGGLQSSLCFNKGQDLARNLSDIYDYCSRQLLKANINGDIDNIREVKGLIDELNSAWELLPGLLKSDPVAKAS
jgi:flagellar protein FliS